MFRTRTGQTGMDAYLNEAAAIMNTQRELDDRLERLIGVVRKEMPEVFEAKSDFTMLPRGGTARSFLEYLRKAR